MFSFSLFKGEIRKKAYLLCSMETVGDYPGWLRLSELEEIT